jgi:uncharacterized protein
MPKSQNPPSHILKRTYGIYAGLILVWILVWTLKFYLIDSNFAWLTTDAGSFTFWTIAKAIIWVLPALWLIRLSERSLKEVFNFSNWRGLLAWGGGIGLLIALAGFVPKLIAGQALLQSEFSFALLNVLAIAPIFEEFLMRGAILGNLEKGYSFLTANIASSLLFIGLHLPGWYFAGSLMKKLTNPLGGASSILILGLLFGYAVHKGKSVGGGMIAHFLNNLSSLR